MLRVNIKIYVFIITLLVGTIMLLGCQTDSAGNTPIKSYSADGYTITLKNATGSLVKGTNPIKVQLTDETGEPIAIDELGIHFMMPAMPPAMPEMHTDLVQVTPVDGEPGTFLGSVTFEEACTWNVTARFKANGNQHILEGFSVSSKAN